MRRGLHKVGAHHRDAHRSLKGPAAISLGAAAILVAIGMPVVWQGALLADDFHNCVAPLQTGLGAFFGASLDRLGAVRPARFLEILLTYGVCSSRLPFGTAIAVPLALTVAAGFSLRGLLRDLAMPAPAPDLAAALWFLQPLGTEIALWPAALHVPLGLLLGLVALRLYLRGRHGWGAVAALAAYLSLEQVILALPVAAWLTLPSPRRRRAAATTAALAALVLLAYAVSSGNDPRLGVPLSERVTALVQDPAFYVLFPAVGVGAHSIPLAVIWAFPSSLLLLVLGGALGWGLAARLRWSPPHTWVGSQGSVLLVASLVALLNLPVVLSVPRQGSPRLFSPTWLVLAATVAVLLSTVRWRRTRPVWAFLGVLAAGALLSLALSVWVRLSSAEFVEASSRRLATMVEDGGVIALCDVQRTVVEPAPRGAFSVHDFIYEWAAQDALFYYTDRRAQFLLAGELWDRPCREAEQVSVVVSFGELLRAWRSAR